MKHALLRHDAAQVCGAGTSYSRSGRALDDGDLADRLALDNSLTQPLPLRDPIAIM